MKKATVFISTAALMAGTACGVYAETGGSAVASFDHSGHHIYAETPHLTQDATTFHVLPAREQEA